ncbi:hypothetical protein ACTFIW_006500 [Dictyostelium discoideum]
MVPYRLRKDKTGRFIIRKKKRVELNSKKSNKELKKKLIESYNEGSKNKELMLKNQLAAQEALLKQAEHQSVVSGEQRHAVLEPGMSEQFSVVSGKTLNSRLDQIINGMNKKLMIDEKDKLEKAERRFRKDQERIEKETSDANFKRRFTVFELNDLDSKLENEQNEEIKSQLMQQYKDKEKELNEIVEKLETANDRYAQLEQAHKEQIERIRNETKAETDKLLAEQKEQQSIKLVNSFIDRKKLNNQPKGVNLFDLYDASMNSQKKGATTKRNDEIFAGMLKRLVGGSSLDILNQTMAIYNQFEKDNTIEGKNNKLNEIERIVAQHAADQQASKLDQGGNGEGRGEQGGGYGERHDALGLYDWQINNIMEAVMDDMGEMVNKQNFVGTIASDQISTLIDKAQPLMSFIMNLDPHDKPGSHWVAVYIDARDSKSLEYYDSFGLEPTDEFTKSIKQLIKKIDPDFYLKFKINKIVEQDVNSSNCGYFCIKFLLNRFSGIPFKECTPLQSKKSEKEIEEMKKEFKEFGYI